MLEQLSDLLGFFSAVLLVVPPLRDQRRRLSLLDLERIGSRGFSFSVTAKELLRQSRFEMQRFSGTDSFLLLGGAILLMLSFFTSIIANIVS